MYEVELKLRADHEDLREKLGELGADHVDSRTQNDTYYNAPHRDFAETDEALRIRHETTEHSEAVAKITYKGPLVEAESKTREEHETVVVDEEALSGILSGLGFEPAARVEKEREFYELDGYTISLDSVSGLGEYIEIEQEATEDDIEAVREGAVDLLSELSLDSSEQIRTSYLGLLLENDM
ncbi:adenylate cyclase class 2 [Halohasta litchfieldiae]|jgi:adenylate cyclase class 2|uniref:Adenylate cyclase n=1 Tax=Halohasta litchfieldiae TaxID=1073996 RepID=A0A1H6RCS2_9EURY|nr:class IV adenylate cyclase [Halohasta litchfieldiae]ATW89729.1 adenylate cyclase class 2 [Halohasta litchfieldiae]SEI53611.1 adenylate cyclase [Halohasta litchfieldiae]